MKKAAKSKAITKAKEPHWRGDMEKKIRKLSSGNPFRGEDASIKAFREALKKNK